MTKINLPRKKHIFLKLDPYQAANLRWLLRLAGNNRLEDKDTGIHCHTGDWNWELIYNLEEEMVKGGERFMDYKPNQGFRDYAKWPFPDLTKG